VKLQIHARRLFLLACLLMPITAAHSDEGMWLVNAPPRELLQKKYGFDLTDAWLRRAQLASIRLNNGGSGSFISPNGLLITNHHVGSDALQKLSGAGKDLFKDGFLAKTQAEELKCPDLELNVLEEIVDVTEQIQNAAPKTATPKEAEAARRALIAKITKESLEKTGLRSDVVTLYHGGLYHLYRYKKYTDVRLVMAPEHGIAFFGGDSDNFEYPRYNLDICFFRVYENGKPAQTPEYFPFSKTGPAEGDLVFVSGHPGTTNRLETLAQLKHRRDQTLPHMLSMLRYREAMLLQYAEKGPEQKRDANRDLYSVANARKAMTGQLQGLLDPAILKTKAAQEDELKNFAAQHADKAYGDPWNKIAGLQAELAKIEIPFRLLERGDAFDSRLFKIARHLVRLSAELPKEDGKRLTEYKSSALESLKFELFSPAPIPRDLDRVELAASLTFLAEKLGGEHPYVKKVYAGKSPAARAEELVLGCKLDSVEERKRLYAMAEKGKLESDDPMIALAKLIEEDARAVREKNDELTESLRQSYASISRVLFDKYGAGVAPDATFTLRLAFGTVQGYSVDGKKLNFHTTFGEAYARADEQGHVEPFELPKRWLDGKEKLDLATPFDFVSTADTIGGNSGSPVLNRAGEFVGINFDRNRHGLVRNFVYTDVQARHIAVHSRAILEALTKLYAADALVQEITGSK
jgi:hypothetical protein